MRHIANKSTLMKQVEHREGVEIEELLRCKFVDENKSIYLMVEELQVSHPTLMKWMDLAGIYSRKLQI